MSKITINETILHGTVAPGFEEVKTEFRRNFAKRGELGAACAIYHKGRKVVDLWGGYRDVKTRAPWEEDTLVLVFSTTKGVASMALAVAHSRGLLDYDETVATYWPEFAQRGKENITVRQLLSHQAGLCVIDEPLDIERMANLDAVAAAIARQKPAWKPGTKHGYHAVSLGFYEGELVRRVDPRHRSLGQFFQDEIAKPLGLEFYIGLPSDVPGSRLATIKPPSLLQFLSHLNALPWPLIKAALKPKSLIVRSVSNPRLRSVGAVNTRAYLSVESPAANGIGQVRSIAKAYSVFATGGSELGITGETIDALTKPAVPPSLGLHDEVLQVDMCFSLGYTKPFPAFRFGSSDKAFGTPGLGGSFAYADPDAQVGFAYAPIGMGFYIWDDPREKALRGAFYRSLKNCREEHGNFI